MSTRKRKQEAGEQVEEELVALPSDESEEEEEYVFSLPFTHAGTWILTAFKDMLTLSPTLTPRKNLVMRSRQSPRSRRDAR